MNIRVVALGVAAVLTAFTMTLHASFQGWQDMRVVRQEGGISRPMAVDLTGDGRQELIVVDTRQSRLLMYRWLDPDARKEAPAPSPDRPNELPMAAEIERVVIPLEELPRDIAAADLTGDGRMELLVLVSPPMKLLSLSYDPNAEDPADRIKRLDSWTLEGGTLSARFKMLIHPRTDDRPAQAILSFENGIQLVDLEADSKPRWLTPRERTGRLDLWLADLNGNGLLDLVEFSRTNERTIRWYENVQGTFAAPVLLSDTAVRQATLLNHAQKPAEVLLMTATPAGQLRRFRMGEGEEGSFRQLRPLPVPVADSANWAIVNIEDEPHVLYIDNQQPRMVLHGWTERGWGTERSFPALSDVESIAAPAGIPGTVLFHAKDAQELHRSRWDGTRMSFPRPWVRHADVEDRKILTMVVADETIWWVQKLGDDLELNILEPDAEEPISKRFVGAGGAEQTRWLGGGRLLFQERFARNPKLAVINEEGETVISEPSQLANIPMTDWVLFGAGEERRLGRMVDGTLQWIGDDLQPIDQVMLAEGARMSGLVLLEDDRALALQQGGTRLIHLEADEAGILRESQRVVLPGGNRLIRDRRIGLLLIAPEMITRMEDGKPRELTLVQSLDARSENVRRLDETTWARIFVTDVTGDGRENLILFDDERRKATLLEEREGELTTGMSWQVFEDGSYPYGGGGADWRGRRTQVSEPREFIGLDIDGDGRQDLAIFSHDRILFYLGAKP
ncbi:MAG: VCBS repeat-containing protein [Phycisphaeraceae bacterium]|nr:VCBS repeat-containing protein [Phycisphaeraceae bacterium]